MTAFVTPGMFARTSGEVSTVTRTIFLGAPTTFLAWGNVTWIDSLDNFDADNAVAIDILSVGGVRTNRELFGGRHLGPDGSDSNLLQGALVRFGQFVTFRLRAFHSQDLECLGYGIVITNP